jgi:hypothetical protein
LKDDNQSERYERSQTPEQPAKHRQIKDLRNEGEENEKDSQPGEYLGAPGSAKVEVTVINSDSEK